MLKKILVVSMLLAMPSFALSSETFSASADTVESSETRHFSAPADSALGVEAEESLRAQSSSSTEENFSAEGQAETEIRAEQSIQSRVNDIGSKLLNANKIQERVVFLYDKRAEKSLLDVDSTVTRRQVVLYDDLYKFTQNDDEVAGLLARGIVTAQRSYMGAVNGYSSAVKIKAAPKKFETVADKIAVDYMVKAGYNPLGLITIIHKSCPQKRFDRFSNKNLTSKRLAVIYEYIYTKYPYFLAHNTYIENEHYQNFLLSSQHNRRLLMEKIKTGSKEELDYE